ncbi:hypothetical protein N7490_000295 [Penicillium lividum]|nr:hypothetical protein N7490_000295 [Penicillium lividum]
MLQLRNTLLWLVTSLLTSQLVLAAIDDYFSLSFSDSVSGTCTGYEDLLDTQMDDVITLAEYMSKAVQYAEMELDQEDEDNEKMTLVARKLFTAYFGIRFDGSAPVEDDEDEWDTLKANIDIYENYITTSAHEYPTQKNHPYLFCMEFGEWFEWNSQALGPDGKGLSDLDGNGLSIKDVYSDTYETTATTPYWVPEMKSYMFLPLSFADDVCDTVPSTSTETILGLCAKGNKAQIEAITGEDTPISEVSSPESILLCSKSFTENGYYGFYSSLDDVEDAVTTALEGDGIDSTLQLIQVVPQSGTLFHEIWHMVTFWDYSGSDTVQDSGDEAVGDVTYDLAQALTIGTAGIKNAQTYVWFAVAWWFYASRDDWSDTTPGTFFTETFEPWTYGE